MLRNPIFYVSCFALLLAGIIHGGVAYWLHADPKLRSAYLYPTTYEELNVLAGAGIMMLAFVTLILVVEFKSAGLTLIPLTYFVLFGFVLDESLVLSRGWMQAGAGFAVVAVLVAKLCRDYANRRQALASRPAHRRIVFDEPEESGHPLT